MRKYLAIVACLFCLIAVGQQPLGSPCTEPPATPGAIAGESSTCNYFGNNLQYCIDSVPGATSYTWVVTPNAATITDLNRCIVLDIDNNFSGTICIEVRANNDCGSSLFTGCFTLEVFPVPQPVITVATEYCLVDEDFPIQVTPAGGTFSGCVQSAVINPADIGLGTCIINYTVTVDGCEGSTFEEIIINPAVVAEITSESTYCYSGTEILLQAIPPGGTFFPSQYFDTGNVGATQITYTITGPYGCSDVDTLDIFVEMPPIANFSYYFDGCGKVCFVDSSINAETWLWEYGDGQTSVELNNCHVFSDTGTYCVTLTVTNACGTADATICIAITCVGIDETVVDQLSLYPNPANGLVNVFFNSAKAQNYMLNVVDVTGKVLYTENLNNFVGQYNNPIDFSRFAAGMYIFRIVAEDGRTANVKLINY